MGVGIGLGQEADQGQDLVEDFEFRLVVVQGNDVLVTGERRCTG